MELTTDIRLACFAAVVFLYMQVTVIVCKNANISGCADSHQVDSSLTLKCHYIGNGDEEAIYWYNGSNLDALALIPGSDALHCDVFSWIDISFDQHRISYTCNPLSNVYTLTIDPLEELDNNVTWSCTFLDPAPDSVKAECIIHISGITDITAGDGRISSTIIIVILIILCISLIAVFISVKLWNRKRSPCKKNCRRNLEQEMEVSYALQSVQAS